MNILDRVDRLGSPFISLLRQLFSFPSHANLFNLILWHWPIISDCLLVNTLLCCCLITFHFISGHPAVAHSMDVHCCFSKQHLLDSIQEFLFLFRLSIFAYHSFHMFSLRK